MTKKEESTLDLIPIREIQTKGDSSLVEFEIDGTLQRRYVPSGIAAEGITTLEILREGIPHGMDLSPYLDLSHITPELVIRSLHEYGIWTYRDLQEKDRVLIRIATDLIGAAVWDAARQAK